MQYVDFFGKKVSKLIVGDNPITGHSYIPHLIPGTDMIDYYKTENVLKLLFELEELGVNTMLPLAHPYILRVLGEFKRAGGKMQFIFQPYMPMNQYASCREMMALEPIGIYHQGTTTDFLYESGKIDEIKENLKKFRELGVPVGLGTHVPEVIERSEEEGWDVDFYLACMHNARKGREGEASGFLTGKTKDRQAAVENFNNNPNIPIFLISLKAGGTGLNLTSANTVIHFDPWWNVSAQNQEE